MKNPRRKSTELVLHIARGHKTFCSKDASGVKLQAETDPITDATCRKCSPVLEALRVMPISEPKLEPDGAANELQQRILDEIRAGAGQDGWLGYVPHSGAYAQELQRLVHRGLVVPTGLTVTYTRPKGEVRRAASYKLAD